MDKNKTVKKYWGEEFYICNNSLYCAKFLYLLPGYVCSTHRHAIKRETFHVLAGTGIIRVGVVNRRIEAGDTVDIPIGTWHHFASAEGMTLLEISTQHFDDDCERLNESHKITKETDPALWELLYEQTWD